MALNCGTECVAGGGGGEEMAAGGGGGMGTERTLEMFVETGRFAAGRCIVFVFLAGVALGVDVLALLAQGGADSMMLV